MFFLILDKLFLILAMGYLSRCQTLVDKAPVSLANTSDNGTRTKRIESFPKVEDAAILITTQVYITDVSDLNAASMDFRVDFFLRQTWLVHKSYCNIYREYLKSIGSELILGQTIIVPPEKINTFWVPDTYIMTAKITDTQSKNVQAKTLMIKLQEEKCHMSYTVRWYSMITCQLEFRKFPMDIQRCAVSMRSFSYPEKMIRYEWSDNVVTPESNRDIYMLEYDLIMTKNTGSITMLNVSYSVLTLKMDFERELAYQMLHVYTPSILVVILAWLSFWMDMDAVPARATLCVTSLLSLITMFTGNSNRLPPVSYANRMDVWMLACMIFVFSTLAEFAFVKYLSGKSDKVATRSNTMTQSMIRIPTYNRIMTRNDLPLTKRSYIWDSKGWTPLDNEAKKPDRPPNADKIKKIDIFFRIVYLILFIFFNFLYWPILLARI